MYPPLPNVPASTKCARCKGMVKQGARTFLVDGRVSRSIIFLQELLSRTLLETQKLDLMAEVSDLKIKLVGMEKEQSEYEEKQSKAEVSLTLFSFLGHLISLPLHVFKIWPLFYLCKMTLKSTGFLALK